MQGSRLDPNLLKGHLEYVLLATIAGEPKYGLEIIQDVQERTGGVFAFKEGTLYPALARLERAGWLAADFRASDRGGPPRKYYRLTPAGEGALDAKREEWRRFSGAVNALEGLS